MALKVGELFASFNLDTSGIDSAVKSAESKMSNLGKNLAIGGAAMTAAVTVPLKQAATAIYEAGTDFDAEMSKVFAIAGDSVTGSVEVMEALRAKALEMGSTTQFTATEAGEAMEYMAMAGWKSEQMLAAIGPLMNLAAAAGADLGTTSDIVTDAMTAFGISATDTWKKFENGKYIDSGINNVEHFADILAAASTNANTNVEMLGESFKYAAPVAGTLGINAEDTAIALGLMANAGIKASQAGTSLRTGLTNLVKPSKQMKAAMDKYGIELITNADGSANLRETMLSLRKAMSGMSETEQAAAAAAIFGKHSMAGWLAIVNASEEDFNSLTEAIDGCTGSASKMASTMLDNAKGDITIFKSALEGLEITLWGLGENGFRKVIQGATKFVDSFRNADKSTQLGVLKMGALAAAIGPAMAGMGGLVTILPKLANTFSLVSGPTALLTIGMLALGAAAVDSNNDIGKTFVKGITKAGSKIKKFGADIEKKLPTLTQNMGNFLKSLTTGIKKGLPGMIDGLTGIITTGIQAISANMPQIAEFSQTIVTTLANSIKKNAPKIIPAVLDLLRSLASALISNIPVVLSGMATVITSLIKEVQNADWGEIATKLRESLEGAIKETGTLFKKLAMGDKYTEEASWADVGTALVTNLMDGIKTGFGNLRDFVGSLLLADDYDPDEDWTTFGTKLIDKIFTGIDDAANGAESFVSGVIEGLAGLFSAANISSATTALSTIVSRIITAAADEIPKLAGHATNILSKLSEMLLGDGKSQGTAAAATEGAMKLAGAIVTSITQAIPKALDAAGNVLNAGLTLAGGLLDSIAGAFTTNGLDLNVGAIVQSLVNNLVRLLPKAFETGGKVISAGMKLASELVKSLAEGFTAGEGLDIDMASVAESLVEGIVSAISNLPALLGDVLSAGAQIANSIMGSIADALVDAEGSGVGGSLGTAATDLVHNLLTKITDFGKNPDVQGFMENLGKGISAAMGMLGDITGKIIAYIFSVQGLTDILNAGISLGKLLIQGIVKGIAGIGNFIKSTIESTLVSFGVLSQEELDAAKKAGAELAQATTDAYNDAASGDLELTGGEEKFINWANFFGGQNLSELDAAATDIVHLFDGAIGAAAEGSDSGEEFRDNLLSNLFWANEDWLMAALEKGINLDDSKLDLTKVLPEIGVNLADILPKFDDLDFWGSLLEAVSNGSKADVMELITGMIQEAAAEAAAETEQAAAESADSSSAIPDEVVEAWNGLPDSVKKAADSVNQETDNFLKNLDESDAGAQFATTITENMGEAETAAAEAANAIATEVLLTLSEENGAIMAEAFLGGLISAFSDDGVLIMAASVMAVKTHDAVQQVLTYASSFRIGKNFGQGLVNGINSMIDAVARAAARLGEAAAGALSGAVQEGSPSKLTAETGRNFGLGFINSILASVDDAGNAAAMVGMSAASSLEQTISEISGDAADQMSITGNGRRNEAEALAAENEKTAMTYASAIANALNGARVVMNGELVGELVTDTVSEGIANRYAGMRYGTV